MSIRSIRDSSIAIVINRCYAEQQDDRDISTQYTQLHYAASNGQLTGILPTISAMAGLLQLVSWLVSYMVGFSQVVRHSNYVKLVNFTESRC